MRAGIGILSILIAVAIILMVGFAGKHAYVPTVVNAGNSGRDQAAQISGQDSGGMRASESIALQAEPVTGNFRGFLVTGIIPTGPMATAYGLMKGDEIIEVGPMRLRDESDPDLAKDLVYESYQRNWPMVIVRNGETITINPDSALTQAHPEMFAKPGMTVTGNAPNAAPATSGPPATPTSPQGQLNAIQQQMQNVPTH